MTDYKSLVESLREEAEAVKAIEWDIPICTSNHIKEAADAIERLQKERDAACEDLKDAVIRDGYLSPCDYCKHLWKSGTTGVCSIDSDCYKVLKWEWRGISDDD